MPGRRTGLCMNTSMDMCIRMCIVMRVNVTVQSITVHLLPMAPLIHRSRAHVRRVVAIHAAQLLCWDALSEVLERPCPPRLPCVDDSMAQHCGPRALGEPFGERLIRLPLVPVIDVRGSWCQWLFSARHGMPWADRGISAKPPKVCSHVYRGN